MHKIATVTWATCTLALSIFRAYGQSEPAQLKKADSLYFVQDWEGAQRLYTIILSDTSRNSIAWNRLGFSNYNIGKYSDALIDYQKALMNKPIPPVKASVYSRMARIMALQHNTDAALNDIDSALVSGYVNFSELDSLKDFNSLRNIEKFKKLREKTYLAANPCMANPRAREFDFWEGHWDVYATGTQTLVGHSVVQIVSGGCALLENWEALSSASTGKSLNFIDSQTNMWRQCWIGSYANGQQDFVNGTYKDGAMRFTFNTTGPQGQKVIGRFIFFNEGADKVRQFNETSADDGKIWTANYDFTYIRVKK